jgi:hypothetical protein
MSSDMNRPRHHRRRSRLFCLFLFAVLLFNYPLLALFDRPLLVAGIPLLYVCLFLVWAGVIGAVYLAVGHQRSRNKAAAEESRSEPP